MSIFALKDYELVYSQRLLSALSGRSSFGANDQLCKM